MTASHSPVLLQARSVIIPACGLGSRYGADVPKHLVDIAGLPMVQRVIDALPLDIDVHLLVRPEYVNITRAAVHHPKLEVSHVFEYSRGVCDTLLSAPVHDHDKTLVVNCDNVIVPPGGWHHFFEYKNAIVTFEEKNKTLQPPPFSYVKTHKNFIVEIAEKRRVGSLACAGAFLFQDFKTLRLLCEWHMTHDRPDVRSEYFLAPAYSRLIEDPTVHVYSVQLSDADVFVRMGTPLEATDARRYYVR